MINIKRGIYALFGLFAGGFLGVRILGALNQIFNFNAPVICWTVFAAVGAVLGFVFCEKTDTHLRLHASGGRKFTLALFLACAAVCYVARYAVLDFQIAPYTKELTPLCIIISCLGAGVLLTSFILHFVHSIKCVFIRKYRITKKDVFAFLLVFIILNALVLLFLKNNRMIAYWDNAGFWITSRNLADMYRENGLIYTLKQIYTSVFTEDYNYIIAVPTGILAYLFGDGRAVYILGVTNLYLYPLYMFAYIIARKRSKYPITVTLFIIMTFPFLFFVSTQGYIDAGAIVVLSLILWLWYQNPNDTSPERSVTAGTLIAVSMILRRWTVFFAIAYIIAFTVDSLIYKKKISPVIWLLGALAFGLLFLFQPYVTVKLMANYSDMYAAYDLGLKTDVFMFIHYIGLLQILCVLAVPVIMLFTKRRREAVFMLLLLVSCFAVFVKIQSHGEQHLMLYTPVSFYILAVMYAYILKKSRIFACVFGAAVSVLPVYTAVTADNSKVGTEIVTVLPCISCMPQQRADIDQILELDSWLDENVGDKNKRVSVLASSLSFNREVLFNAEASLNIKRKSNSNRDEYMPWLPQVDGRDDLPYTVLETEYVLVADPIQTHLNPENQRVVTIPAESFLNNTDIAHAFKKIDKTFTVGDKNVFIYEKTREISEEEREEFLARF